MKVRQLFNLKNSRKFQMLRTSEHPQGHSMRKLTEEIPLNKILSVTITVRVCLRF